MNNAKWIWYFGEFEIYHNLLVHTRREDMGCDYPCSWAVDTPYSTIEFKPINSKIKFSHDTVIHVYSNGRGVMWLNWDKFPINKDVKIKAGEYNLKVNIMCDDGTFPSIFIDNEYIKTNENWTADFGNKKHIKVGYNNYLCSCNDNPLVFPFCYETLNDYTVKDIDGGKLYDFKKETFARVTLTAENPNDEIFICYGESEQEALDPVNSIIRESLKGKTQYILKTRAFRYLFISGNAKIKAEYEYLPLENKAKFKCDNELINKIYDVCDYTFKLNSREFYLDGIKRDRWVWSGDAYQSFMINNYLYKDKGIVERTIVSLLGKPPVVQHVNTINDYSMYLIISVYDYYKNFGDRDFIERIFERVKNLYNFIITRLDENGLVYEWEEDWVFIDWANFDKSGPLCAEQILLWKTHHTMGYLSEILGENSSEFFKKAEKLKEFIIEKFWSDKDNAFIDCFSSGKNHITRHANIFAILYNFVDSETKEKIVENVLENDKIDEITTPYFKLYELMALCECNRKDTALVFIKNYWGGMINLGATTIWEEFKPNLKGDEHYSMYGVKFGKSLCHAWGSGPILLLLKYFVGVKEDNGLFIVEPELKYFNSLDCIVPIGNGSVEIKYNNNKLIIKTKNENATVNYNNKSFFLGKNEQIEL